MPMRRSQTAKSGRMLAAAAAADGGTCGGGGGGGGQLKKQGADDLECIGIARC